jgi:2-dehydro-3-deoxygalactonokinase
LAKTCLPDAPLKKDVFLDGVMQSQKPGGLLHHAFSARSLALFEKLNPAQSSSYISGLLIGEEIKSAKTNTKDEGTPLFILGNGQLTQRYGFAMEALGISATALADEVTWTGLWALAHHLYPNDFKLS